MDRLVVRDIAALAAIVALGLTGCGGGGGGGGNPPPPPVNAPSALSYPSPQTLTVDNMDLSNSAFLEPAPASPQPPPGSAGAGGSTTTQIVNGTNEPLGISLLQLGTRVFRQTVAAGAGATINTARQEAHLLLARNNSDCVAIYSPTQGASRAVVR
jgi:hypothetical protein